MQEKTLFLAWHGSNENRFWFPVGRLDADPKEQDTASATLMAPGRPKNRPDSQCCWNFPELDGDYWASELFPLFQNRIMSPSRPDFQEYLKVLGLGGYADPVEILAVNGGRRLTDTYEVFPKLVKQDDGSFVSRFFLHGNRFVSESGRERLNSLRADEELYVAVELTNPSTELAVLILTTDYQVLGWAPHYLVDDWRWPWQKPVASIVLGWFASIPNPFLRGNVFWLNCPVSGQTTNPCPAPTTNLWLIRRPMRGRTFL